MEDEDKYQPVSDDPMSNLILEAIKNDDLRKMERAKKWANAGPDAVVAVAADDDGGDVEDYDSNNLVKWDNLAGAQASLQAYLGPFDPK